MELYFVVVGYAHNELCVPRHFRYQLSRSRIPEIFVKMSKFKKYVDEVRETNGKELEILDKGVSTLVGIPGFRKYAILKDSL